MPVTLGNSPTTLLSAGTAVPTKAWRRPSPSRGRGECRRGKGVLGAEGLRGVLQFYRMRTTVLNSRERFLFLRRRDPHLRHVANMKTFLTYGHGSTFHKEQGLGTL